MLILRHVSHLGFSWRDGVFGKPLSPIKEPAWYFTLSSTSLSSGPLFRDEEKVESGHSVLCGIMEGAVSPSGRRESLQENKVLEVRSPPSFPPLPIAEDHLF